MASKPKTKNMWQNLLKVSSKNELVKLCHQAILYRGLEPDHIPESIVAMWSSQLSATKGETKQIISSLSVLLQRAVFICSSDTAAVSTCFPKDMSKDLGDLLATIVINNFSNWKSALIVSNATLPQLVDVKCTVDSSITNFGMDELPATEAKCDLQLKMQDHTSVDQSYHTVNVQLTKEKLNAMLDGLGKIKNQLASVA